jgi:hypothetical protein
VSAAVIDIPNVQLTAFGSFSTQFQPVKTDFDPQSAPLGSLTPASEVLIIADNVTGMPFPNVPTSQTRPFASSIANADGHFGIGVNGFFLQNSLPTHTLLASGSVTQTYINNSDLTFPMELEFNVPAPTIRFRGVGESTFPMGADPARDATADAVIDLVVTTTLPSGNKIEVLVVDYGLQVLRAQPSTVLFPFPRRDGVGKVTRFDEPGGTFGFLLPALQGTADFSLGPRETLEFAWHYTAKVQTGFGETGVFGAIGDPFEISAGGGLFDIQVGGPAAIPEPATLLMLGLGLAVLVSARLRAIAAITFGRSQ